MANPVLTLGPQDPESTSGLTARLGVHNKADKLLARVRANYPEELTRALARPLDAERTASLDLEEVEGKLRSLEGRRAFFKEDHELVDASVRGDKDENRVVSVLFRLPSGRTARGVIPYEGLSRSARAFEEAQEAQEPARAGRVRQASSAKAAEGAEEILRGYEERLQQVESQLADREERLARAENPEPWEGYDETGAKDRADRIKEGGIEEFGRAGLERIRTYEESRPQKSKQVLSAIEDALAERQPGD